jgi:hypothetical protein
VLVDLCDHQIGDHEARAEADHAKADHTKADQAAMLRPYQKLIFKSIELDDRAVFGLCS